MTLKQYFFPIVGWRAYSSKHLHLNFHGEYGIKYLTANKNVKQLAEQALKYNPDTVCIVQKNYHEELALLLKNTDITITSGRNALLELAGRNDVDLVMNG